MITALVLIIAFLLKLAWLLFKKLACILFMPFRLLFRLIFKRKKIKE
ncbi:MAG: hypothetical protein FWD58_05495 [Firmicutes bacterium]|nr:hypothetical protein [Bacillota bacterium]